ncbi:MAG: hypothetical protein R2801_09745 [Chitinophagales bacterium]
MKHFFTLFLILVSSVLFGQTLECYPNILQEKPYDVLYKDIETGIYISNYDGNTQVNELTYDGLGVSNATLSIDGNGVVLVKFTSLPNWDLIDFNINICIIDGSNEEQCCNESMQLYLIPPSVIASDDNINFGNIVSNNSYFVEVSLNDNFFSEYPENSIINVPTKFGSSEKQCQYYYVLQRDVNNYNTLETEHANIYISDDINNSFELSNNINYIPKNINTSSYTDTITYYVCPCSYYHGSYDLTHCDNYNNLTDFPTLCDSAKIYINVSSITSAPVITYVGPYQTPPVPPNTSTPYYLGGYFEYDDTLYTITSATSSVGMLEIDADGHSIYANFIGSTSPFGNWQDDIEICLQNNLTSAITCETFGPFSWSTTTPYVDAINPISVFGGTLQSGQSYFVNSFDYPMLHNVEDDEFTYDHKIRFERVYSISQNQQIQKSINLIEILPLPLYTNKIEYKVYTPIDISNYKDTLIYVACPCTRNPADYNDILCLDEFELQNNPVRPLCDSSIIVIQFNTVYGVQADTINQITGRVYFDVNTNNQPDNGDVFIDNIKLQLAKNNTTSIIATSDSGKFHFYADTGTYTLQPITNFSNFSTTPTNYNISYNNYGNSDTFNFKVNPTALVNDASVTLINNFRTRPNNANSYTAIVQNESAASYNGVLKVLLSENVAYQSSSPSPTNIINDTLFFTITNLPMYNQQRITINFIGDIALQNGQVIKSIANINNNQTDVTPSNNETSLLETIATSYDPNEKVVDNTIIHPQLIGNSEYSLLYTIHFQNIGNDTAFNIVIYDTLDNNLNWNTIQPITASHNYSFEQNNGKYIQFKFNNIYGR